MEINHPFYGPCDGFGPNNECSVCREQAGLDPFGRAFVPDSKLTYNWESLKENISDWADATFGKESHVARAKHIKEEAQELIRAYDFESPIARKAAIGEELADIFIIASHVARVEGVDLFKAISEKFEIVKGREWEKPDHQGIIRHKKVQKIK